ncbi:hypothetical protein CH373_05460 [Leptospira perolatii]|uniref:GyrI-like small molecule binding domain-containing protein n=1 Tax=Leptospira perolatii TaxID=2023191 RepID=A0A2M9ZQZ4_9LEPT|nr:GyrI-like domain-containing protein [Leptospira perolatii]PJZ70517.1 hypothetical protein CH360_05880 [Leptospira perolatii]PJZ74353.1 hypothetical protein CH373_05460 [Leptospira perolatii]
MKKLSIVLLSIVLLVLVFFFYMGAFETIQFQKEVKGPYYLLYQSHTGAYKDIGSVISTVDTYATETKLPIEAKFGLYYDNPNYVPDEKLRSEGGVVLSKKAYEGLPQNLEKFGVRVLPQGEYLVTRFPYKNPLSILFGVFKVYPAFSRYAKENKFKEYVYKENDYKDEFISEIYLSEDILYLIHLPQAKE